MIVVMYAGGIPFNGATLSERSLGGSESACYYVARELAARGHEVTVFTEHREGGVWDGVRYCFAGERTPDAPLGADWHFFVENTPHDVNIAQRHPLAYHRRTQAKVNLWWAHDICVRRNDGPFMAGAWQVDGVLTVSEWFKRQMCSVWTVNPDVVFPVHNGVDYEPFRRLLGDEPRMLGAGDGVTLIYCSRPERGLEHLVGEGGVMEKLLTRAPDARLLVCGYEHAVPEMQGYYDGLRRRVDELPNCEHLGALTKEQLYELMCTRADAWVYPTEFEEVSCITAMECMAAGLRILATDVGALRETVGNYLNATFYPCEFPSAVERMVNAVARFSGTARTPRMDYPWTRAVDEIEAVVDATFRRLTADRDALARHLLRHSDIQALRLLVSRDAAHQIRPQVSGQLEHYAFDATPEAFAEHYAVGTARQYDDPDWRYEGNFHLHPRYREVAEHVSRLPAGATVVDYGCAHGHFTNNLAKEFPDKQFVGLDVSPRALELARDRADQWGLDNVEFLYDDWLTAEDGHHQECDLLLLGEVLEHVPDPASFMRTAGRLCGPCHVVVTTPFGPWEAASYEAGHPWRFHLHHLEKADLRDLFGGFGDLDIRCMPAAHGADGSALGWYITSFDMGEPAEFGEIDYDRKLSLQAPRQTVSFCGIVRDGEATLMKMLRSVEPLCDEIILGVDEKTTDRTRQVIEDFAADLRRRHRAPYLPVHYFDVRSPTETGFDVARNTVLERATHDWVLWLDADEELVEGARLLKYLRNSGWRGLAVAQHHFSVEPLGVLNTDLPVRVFRRDPKVRFLGVVHEHPERVDNLNEGVGFAWVLPDLHIAHHGYSTEAVRRLRFRRNISLIARDRKENPDRLLGKFLWIRDLALMNRFEAEVNGGVVTPEMNRRARMGLELWEETITRHADHPQVRRMVADHLDFYDTLVGCAGGGFTFRFKVASGLNGSAPQLSQVPELSSRFLNKRHLDKFLSVIVDREVEHYEDKYL